MQFSASRPPSSASTAVRPLSSKIRWNSCGPSPGVTPVHIEVYGFIRSPVEDRGSSCRNTSRSCQRGTSFSIPMTVIKVSGRVRHIRPLPSDSTTAKVPLSATAKLAPLIATFADRNFRRRCLRAAPASAAGSSVSSGSTSAISRRKISRISARLRWMAGTRMCDGLSWPSWTISSARSVSSAAIPAASKRLVEPDLLGRHRLDLHHLVDALRPDQIDHDRIGLGGVARPVHHPAMRGDRVLQLGQILGKVSHGVYLQLPARLPELLPVSHLGDHLGALGPDGPRGVAEVLAELGVGERVPGRDRERLLAAQVAHPTR